MLRRLTEDIAAAGMLLTRLPGFAAPFRDKPPDLTRSIWAYPLIGALIGGIGAIVLLGGDAAGLPPMLGAGLAIGAQLLATGGFHEDGLADTADGLGGGSDAQRKLEIMRDSRIGSYGTLALLIVIGLRWTAVASLPATEAAALLIAAGALSRGGILVALATLKPARPEGMGAVAANPKPITTAAGLLIALTVTIASLPWPLALAAACIALLPPLLTAAVSRRQIGGYTGDVLGAAAALTETAVLIAVASAALRSLLG